MREFYSRVMIAFSLARADLDAIGPSKLALLSTPDMLIDLVYAKALKRYTQKVKYMLHNTVKDAGDVDFDKQMQLYFQAAEL